MSATDKEAPPLVPPKERSPSPDDGLLREEPLEVEPKSKHPVTSAEVPTATAPSNPAQTVTASPAPTVETEDEGENPPPKPPRPVSQFEQNVATLAEAFPDIELAVIKAVLTASGGRVEPAFNALLGMSDPSAAAELDETPPPQPPRPRAPQQPRDFRESDNYNPATVYHDQPQQKTSTSASQLEADEIYARQLAEHYGGTRQRGSRQGRGGYGNYPETRTRQAPQAPPDDEDRERSFFDDELPVLTENIRKGFFETQTKVSKFITEGLKKFTGEEEEEQHRQQAAAARGGGGGSRQQPYPQRYSSRRPGEAYDADPEVLQGDFSHLEMRDNSEEPRRNRQIANPNLFGSGANQPEEDLYRKPTSIAATTTSPSGATGPGSTAGSKWAPLSTVEPTPLTSDPFQLADSDDEHDNIQTTAAKTGPQESGTKGAPK
ncbi:hypothetical protein ABW20_dc0109231 [Dactylellina cionopaga]|nr:hypothetical protein ABW20_dc0109231 [Dactylellina cionopaga]